MRRVAVLCLVTSALVALLAAPCAQAQAVWDAQLAISAFPSPYLSDWEANPTIATLTITNPTAADQTVLLAYRVTDGQGRQLASGRSDPQLVPRGAPTVITDVVNVSGSSQHDQALESQMRRTGRLPEGDNTACVAVTDQGGFVLAEDCATFSIVYPDPPYLIGPLDDAALASGYPIFQWTPLQVPPAFHLTYVLRLSEVLEGQTPLQSLVANIPVYQVTTGSTSLEYPLGALPLVEGRTYAWRVQALDQNGYAASSNEGRSEVWSFRYDSEQATTPQRTTPMTFTLFNAYDRSTGNPSAPAGYPPVTYKFNDICDNWGSPPPEGLALDVNVPFGFKGFQADEASLFRQTDSTSRNASRKWWIYAQLAAGPRVLLHGDCRNRLLGGFQWIALRTPGLESSISSFVGSAGGPTGTFQSLDFGVWVAALFGGTVSVPEDFVAGQEFLEGREFDVQRGFNGVAVLDLRDHALTPLFEALGYEEREITLQGFIGLDAHHSIGAGMGESAEVTVSQEKSYLLLSAALPERVPFGPLARIASSMQLSFEFEIEDSVGVNVSRGESGGVTSSTSRSFDYVFRIKHTINLRDDLFSRPGQGSRALVGWLGADIARETEQRTRDIAQRGAQANAARLNRAGQAVGGLVGARPARNIGRFFGDTLAPCAPRPSAETSVKLVVNYGLEGQLFMGSSGFFLEDPALEIQVGVTPAANGQRDLTFAIVTGFGVEGFDQRGILGISREREYPDQPTDPACQTTRPRSTTLAGDTPAPSTTTPQGPLSSPWKWSWKVAWDIVPAGTLGAMANIGLGAFFFLFGQGGT